MKESDMEMLGGLEMLVMENDDFLEAYFLTHTVDSRGCKDFTRLFADYVSRISCLSEDERLTSLARQLGMPHEYEPGLLFANIADVFHYFKKGENALPQSYDEWVDAVVNQYAKNAEAANFGVVERKGTQ